MNDFIILAIGGMLGSGFIMMIATPKSYQDAIKQMFAGIILPVCFGMILYHYTSKKFQEVGEIGPVYVKTAVGSAMGIVSTPLGIALVRTLDVLKEKSLIQIWREFKGQDNGKQS